MENTSQSTHREVPFGGPSGRRSGRPRSGVLLGVVIVACYASGLAVIGHLWVLFWVCAGLVILAVPAGKVIGTLKVIEITDDTVAAEHGPRAGWHRRPRTRSVTARFMPFQWALWYLARRH